MQHLQRFSLLLLFVFTIILTYGQGPIGELRGYVYDETGFPMIGATIILDDTQNGATTDLDGLFVIKDIQPGTYNLTISYLGYKSITEFNIIVKSVGNPPLSFQLDPAVSELYEVVVTNSQVSRPKENPVSFQKFSSVEIATYPGGNNDVVRVAQSLPGVSPSVGGFRNDLIIRGGAPNETVYYLDGVEIPNINHFGTQGSGGGPAGMLNVSFINQVSLSSSSFGAQYDNPLSGVLQFDQRTGNRNKFTGNVRVSATEAALTLEGPLFKGEKEESNTSFIVSGRRSYLKLLFKGIGLPLRPDYWDYQYKLTHKIGKYDEINLIGIDSIDEFSVEAPKDYDQNQQSIIDQTPFIEQNTNTIGLSWTRHFKDASGSFRAVLSNNRLKNTFTRYEDNENKANPFFSNDAIEIETKLRLEYTKYFHGYKVMTGLNTQYSNYSNNTFDQRNNLLYDTKINFFKYGAFANITKSFFEDKVDVSVGFRLDADHFTKNNIFKTFSPRASIAYELVPSWKINASIGRYYKLLPYTILGYRDQAGTLVNQSSDYTRSDHFVLGVSKEISKASSISLEGFYKKYSNYPVSLRDQVSLANKGAGFEVLGNEPVNTDGKGKTYGLELLFQQKLTKNFYGIFSYTYFFSKFSGADEDQYLPSVWDSRHLLSFTGGYQFKRNWETSLRWRFAGKTPFVPVDVNASTILYPQIVLDYNRLGEKKLKVFSQVDIRIDKKWNFKKLALNLYFEAQNALFQNSPQPPKYVLNRNDDGNVITPRELIAIEDKSNTLIPVIGIVLDF